MNTNPVSRLMVFLSSASLLVFFLLLIAQRGVLNSPPVITDLCVPPFRFITLCCRDFEATLSGAHSLRMSALPCWWHSRASERSEVWPSSQASRLVCPSFTDAERRHRPLGLRHRTLLAVRATATLSPVPWAPFPTRWCDRDQMVPAQEEGGIPVEDPWDRGDPNLQ